MDYYEIDTMPSQDRAFVFLDNEPVGTNMFTHRMAMGFAMGDKYPSDAKIFMNDRHPGLKLPHLIGNTNRFLIVNSPLKALFQATGLPMECLPFTLMDHKKREASRDYFIINPLGTFDCMDLKKSEIEWSKEEPGEIVGVDRTVLDPKKLEAAPDFFRIKEIPTAYVVSARLAAEFQKLQPTNVFLTKLDVAA
jgi:hypothetical protein